LSKRETLATVFSVEIYTELNFLRLPWFSSELHILPDYWKQQ